MYKSVTRNSRSESQLQKNGKWSRSESKTRRRSLPRKQTSQRVIRTIGLNHKAVEISNSPVDFVSDGLLKLSLGSESQEIIEVPYVKATLDPYLPTEYFKSDVFNLIIVLKIPKWFKSSSSSKSRVLNLAEMKITVISGSMTNAVFKVEYPRLPSLLLRVYGPNVSTLIDRDYELQTLARLSVKHIAPSLYGCFLNGRFEQFLENSRTLNKEQLREWKTSQRIARRMKEFHTGVPLLNWEKQHFIVWSRIEKWASKIELSTWGKSSELVENILLIGGWDKLKSIIQRYKEWLVLKNEFKKPLVFCHNDTQYGNLLFTSPVVSSEFNDSASIVSASFDSLFQIDSGVSFDEIIPPSVHEKTQDSKLVVIDFEYSGPNPAAFDLANHLSEWMSDYHCADSHKTFESRYPKKKEILNFVYSYVFHLSNTQDSIDDEVRQLYNSIIKWRACVSLHWALWGIIQSGKLESNNNDNAVVEEQGPGGEKYIITVNDTEGFDSDVDSDGILNGGDEEFSEPKGADISSFNYLAYASEKMRIFYGDLIGLGVISNEDLLPNIILKRLDVTFL